jgi:hypothetical protein
MKKSELKRLIREVVEEVEKFNGNAKQDEVEYVKAQLKAHPEIAQQIMKAFSSAQKSSKSDEKMAEGAISNALDPKYMGLMAAGLLATTPIHIISKIFNKNSTLGPDLMEKLTSWYEDYRFEKSQEYEISKGWTPSFLPAHDKKLIDKRRKDNNDRILKQLGLR